MVAKVGIPRALGYYDYAPLWLGFFQELGAEVVLSPPTTRKILEDGVMLAVDDTCLPVKTFYGHVNHLCQQNVDYLFLPRLISVAQKEYICPKFMGIPDIVSGLPDLPPVISPLVNLTAGWYRFYREIYRTGRYFTKSPTRIWRAYQFGLNRLRAHREKERSQLTNLLIRSTDEVQIGLLGHSYLLEDSFINMGLREKLAGLGVKVFTPELFPVELLRKRSNLWPKRMFWTSGRRLLGAALEFLERSFDGIVYLAAFGCGTDSLTGELIQRLVNRRKVPCLLLNVDEHTGEAGLLTRIEAFTDMLRWEVAR